jgi:hypothetical protein
VLDVAYGNVCQSYGGGNNIGKMMNVIFKVPLLIPPDFLAAPGFAATRLDAERSKNMTVLNPTDATARC